jgi:hypothetical protein
MAQNQQKHHVVEIAHFAESPEVRKQFEEHLQQILEGSAFRGSQRSEQFLRYIVEQALAKHYEMLKERMIGVELFGRQPSYETGEDAIVRVTASDVRRRLLQHYGKYGSQSPFHICLPSGSYVPEIEYNQLPLSTTAEALANPAAENAAKVRGDAAKPAIGTRWWRHKLAISILFNLLLLCLVGGILLRDRFGYVESHAKSVLPWAAIFRSGNRMILVPSDPNLAEIQMLEGTKVSVSEYAKHNYYSHNDLPPEKLSPDERFERRFLRGDKSSAVDLPISVSIARLAEFHQRAMEIRGPRSLQFSDLKTDDNFIFLGSPQSNPWTLLFADQLDFRFAYDDEKHAEYILNEHRRENELLRYDASQGNSYAILAFVQNPDQNGHVLLIGGLTAEATESAGRLATDMPRLAETLHQCGVKETGVSNFELLLHLNWVPGYPNHIQVLACHILPSSSEHPSTGR